MKELKEVALSSASLRQLKSIGAFQAAFILKIPFTGREQLSQREFEVIFHLIDGCSSIQTAQRLNISSKTVETHRRNIRQKLGAKNPADVVRIVFMALVDRANELQISWPAGEPESVRDRLERVGLAII